MINPFKAVASLSRVCYWESHLIDSRFERSLYKIQAYVFDVKCMILTYLYLHWSAAVFVFLFLILL